MPWVSLQTLHELIPLAGIGIKSEILRHGSIVAFFLLLPIFLPRWKSRRQINDGAMEKKELLREIPLAILSLLIFGIVVGLILFARQRGLTRIYLSVSDYGWPYFFLSVVLLTFLHDTFFYWSHRALHTRFLFEKIHSIHHLSRRPNPISALSFHPIEAVFQGLTLPLVVFLVPVHPVALFLFALLLTLANAYGHCGYEAYPRWLMDSKWARGLVTSTFHNLHHSRSAGNYGIYFTFWDRLCGTADEDYPSVYRNLVEPKQKSVRVD